MGERPESVVNLWAAQPMRSTFRCRALWLGDIRGGDNLPTTGTIELALLTFSHFGTLGKLCPVSAQFGLLEAPRIGK